MLTVKRSKARIQRIPARFEEAGGDTRTAKAALGRAFAAQDREEGDLVWGPRPQRNWKRHRRNQFRQ